MESVKKQTKVGNKARFLLASAINAGVMVVSGVYGGSHAHSGFLVEAAHDLGDATVHGSRALVEDRSFSNWRYRRAYLYGTYGLTSVLSGIFAFKAGLDIRNSFGAGFHKPNIAEFGLSALVAISNQAALQVLSGGDTQSENLRHAIHHGKADRNASLAYAAALTCGAIGMPMVSEVGALTMGSYVAVEMRPTPHNISHHSAER